MAAALPTFPEFDVTHTSTQAARWKKWQSRFRNLLVAMNVTDKKRKRALLLHNAGETKSLTPYLIPHRAKVKTRSRKPYKP